MPKRSAEFHAAVVQTAATGVDNFPSTFRIIEAPAVPIRAGLNLILYIRDNTILTHQGYYTVVRLRVKEENIKEFIIRRMMMTDDDLPGDLHFLIVAEDRSADRWTRKLRSWGTSLAERAKNAARGSKSKSSCPFLPPTPPPTPASLSFSAASTIGYTSGLEEYPRSSSQSLESGGLAVYGSSLEAEASVGHASCMLEV
ncbi:hypothetical protein OH76DRAFT_1486583 [Lentinus brumalis]|uniref:Uncharacterized protein n=1 Tax=Lentinus brumalis TaxID=2498619 RepID=A0A371CXY8_9APHY|nr:hypothetical protein OH76DRAFT_1486583 [Polyporus brumalis]